VPRTAGGIRRVVSSESEQKDLRELPDEVRKETAFIFADRIRTGAARLIPKLSQGCATA